MAEARMNTSLGCDLLKSGLAVDNRFRCMNDPSKATVEGTIPSCALKNALSKTYGSCRAFFLLLHSYDV